MDLYERSVAIVGVGAILPEAPNVEAFWQNILNKRYSISEVPTGRWGVADYYDADPKAPDKSYSKIGGWVTDFEFDWKCFRIPPKVADAMDPGQQWGLTIAAEALADYGYPERPLNTERTAVIIGTAMGGEQHYHTTMRLNFPEYAAALQQTDVFQELPDSMQTNIMGQWHGTFTKRIPEITEDTMPGELPNIVSGRIANVLNLRGPNFITDAACASSMAAIEAALEMLSEHKVDAAVAGGVDRNMGASTFIKFCKIGALSATGTRPFGEGADGFVMGEGAAVFLLKRLEDAERDGDNIYAIIRGVGGASDGKGKGITAPNPIGQQLAMQRAWENAGINPATVSLLEAHGTSTRVGDVVEVESLNKVFGQAKPKSVGLGSVKSNIGHLKAGAGAAGLLKATLALHHKILPPTLNAEKPNPNINFEQTPFYLLNEAQPWSHSNGTPRRAGVSAYGFGGTNFHIVLEEYVPGAIKQEAEAQKTREAIATNGHIAQAAPPRPVRGILALGADTPAALKEELDTVLKRVESGWTPPINLPGRAERNAQERLFIDFGDQDELLGRLQKARKVLGFDTPEAWKAMQAQGIFRGSGRPTGKLAYMFPGQGSQYVNMGKELAEQYPVVAQTLAEADAVMEPILGQPLTSYLFVDPDDKAAVNQAAVDLMQTAITQPAMLTLDTAIYRLLEQFGFQPDMVMGHSLGEYAGLIAAGILPFSEALEASAARGREMSAIDVPDNGKMAAVMAPYEVVVEILQELDGYAVPANINSHSQCVIGGSSDAIDQAVEVFQERGYQAMTLPVSHAFHTSIVAPASGPLRQMLNRLHVAPPQLPLVANVTGEFYPTDIEAIKDLLEKQIASPVQWVKGLHTLYSAGARFFLEVGPKRALRGFANDLFKEKKEIVAMLTNHPKAGELPTFNQALCSLYAAGYGMEQEKPVAASQPQPASEQPAANGQPLAADTNLNQLTELLAQALQQNRPQTTSGPRPYDRNETPAGSIVISGTGLGLPGAEKAIMDPENALRILRGEQFIDLIPERFRRKMVDKRIVRLVKSEDGSGSFATIDDPDDVIKLAGRPGSFDLTEEYGVPEKLVEALDITTQLATAAGLDALREAGIPLVQTYKRTTTGRYLPEKWVLPEALRDETGVIFASAFPGGDRFTDEFTRYHTYQNRLDQLNMLEDLRRYTQDSQTLQEINRRISELRTALEAEPYNFDRRFLFRILSMGHSQFAQYIGARGPNTQVNAACASTAQAVSIAEDWIRTGRCRRVVVIAADDVTGDNLMEWVGAGFLAVGAATTNDKVDEAALPFDRRRHGTILGMGACAVVVESEDAVQERGMRGIVELLSSETSNSAFHGTRLDVKHISLVMEHLVSAAERRFGLNRYAIAPQTVFVSHETFTPARGGSASAEVIALRETFGEAASNIIMANTKGFTGHPMGVGVEDVIAIKILEHGIVPPVPNFKEVDPDLGPLNLSRGGRYPVQYGLHLAAGFGSQIAFTFLRRIPGGLNRIDNQPRYQRWLDEMSGYSYAQTEVVKRVLRIKAAGAPPRPPAPSIWRYGTGPTVHTPFAAEAATAAPSPARMVMPEAVPKAASHKPSAVSETPVAEPPKPAAPPPPPKAASPPPEPTPTVSSQPAPAAAPPPPAADEVAEKVLALVAEQTGYPPDMLDLDLDLEADLGIDTVKQAETFAAIREAFDIPRRDDLKLRDYPTLEAVIGFVKEMRPELGAVSAKPLTVSEQPTVSGQPPMAAPTPAADEVADKVLAIVAEQTGYPTDMLDLDLDLEADLGIDTVKQAETFQAIRETFDIPRQDNLQLRDYPTLESVIGFVKEMRPELRPTLEAVSEQPAATPSPAADEVADKVLAIVAEQTGYPTDMLELDLDLEADLGIDTVKQAETFQAIRETFDIPRQDNLQLRDYPTLESVIGFVKEMRPELGAVSAKPLAVSEAPVAEDQPSAADLSAADQIPRRVPTPMMRPALEWCKPTGVTLDENSRVVIMPDSGGVSKALFKRLEKLGVTTFVADPRMAQEALAAQLEGWLSEGAIQGVYWLPALDAEPALEEMDLATWKAETNCRVKLLYTTMRTLYDSISEAGTFLLSGTRLGGLHGYGADGATAPLGGGVTGFTKAYKRERPEVLVKAVDFPVSRKTAALADRLIAETLTDPGIVEVGYLDEQRYTITLTEQPAADGQPGLELNNETVFLVTGAAGGITSAIVADLAKASGGVFYLLDLVEAPARDDAEILLFRSDQEALRQQLIDEVKTEGKRPTPVVINKYMLAIERREAALRAIETVEAAGGTVHYRSVDLLDGEALPAVVDEIRERYGRIDALIHAGGIEISKGLADKPAEQFDLVFDIKADGFFSLLRAAKEMPIGATVVFSSVAGRFGNSGQTDYSAANDLLCKLSSSLRHWRPDTRGIAIDWTAWGEIGMATRGSIPTIMKAAGIDMLPPEVGIPTVRRELVSGGFSGEIVVGGALGMMTEEFDDSGGLDTAKVNEALAEREPALLMIGEVKAARLYGGLEVETTLDPNEQPFLYDHAPDEDTPWLPGVMGTEALAELATLLLPDYQVAAVENEAMRGAFKFFRMEPRTLYLSAVWQPAANGEVIARTVLRSLLQPKREGLPTQVKIHYTADVRLTPTVPEAPTMAFDPPNDFPIPAEAIYEQFFHGPAYQVLSGAKVAGNTAVGLINSQLPAAMVPEDAVLLMHPRLVESCFQAAALWSIEVNNAMAFPLGFAQVRAYRPLAEAQGTLHVIVETADGGQTFDGRVVDEAGQLFVELQGYHTVGRPDEEMG